MSAKPHASCPAKRGIAPAARAQLAPQLLPVRLNHALHLIPLCPVLQLPGFKRILNYIKKVEEQEVRPGAKLEGCWRGIGGVLEGRWRGVACLDRSMRLLPLRSAVQQNKGGRSGAASPLWAAPL